MTKTLEKFYGQEPRESPDFGRVVTAEHAKRLKSLLDHHPGRVLCGGEVVLEERYIAPTIIAGIYFCVIVLCLCVQLYI